MRRKIERFILYDTEHLGEKTRRALGIESPTLSIYGGIKKLSWIITRKNDKVLQFYCDDEGYMASWGAFASGRSHELRWNNSGEINSVFVCQFPTRAKAEWYLDRYLEIKMKRGESADLEKWTFKIREYMR